MTLQAKPAVATDDFDERRLTVAAGLAERKLDGFLAAFSPNLRYLSGFTGSNGNLLIAPGAAILFTDPRYSIQAAEETACSVRIAKGPLVGEVAAAIRKLRLKNCARACPWGRLSIRRRGGSSDCAWSNRRGKSSASAAPWSSTRAHSNT
jgi:Xaa-Pro aminopeptidase